MTTAAVQEPEAGGLFEEIMAKHTLHLAPKYLGNVSGGVKETLHDMLLKYSPDLKAVPVAYTKADYHVDGAAPIMYDNPCVHLEVRVRWLAVSPRPGVKAAGALSSQGPEHLSLLLLSYFNVTIPANQLKTKYDWDEAESCWVSRDSRTPLALGDSVKFEILNFVNEGSVLLINGSVDKLYESPAADVKRTPKKESKRLASSSAWQVDEIEPKTKEKKDKGKDKKSKKRKQESE